MPRIVIFILKDDQFNTLEFSCQVAHLKGPKLEIFVAEFFTQTKPLWVDDLETRK